MFNHKVVGFPAMGGLFSPLAIPGPLAAGRPPPHTPVQSPEGSRTWPPGRPQRPPWCWALSGRPLRFQVLPPAHGPPFSFPTLQQKLPLLLSPDTLEHQEGSTHLDLIESRTSIIIQTTFKNIHVTKRKEQSEVLTSL